MFCGGDSSLAQLSLLYYFVGTLQGQHEDEQGVVRLLKKLVKEGDVFFDLGANFGFYTSYVLPLCGKSGAIHSFEPNLFLIPHPLPFYGSDRIGCSSLYPHGWLNQDTAITVPVITIDEYIHKNGIRRIDAMKIDIEGAELDALEGMEETLRESPPQLIVCELSLMKEKNDCPKSGRASSAAHAQQIAEFLKERGYDLCRIANDGRLYRWEATKMTTDADLKLINVAFVRPELKEQRSDLFADR